MWNVDLLKEKMLSLWLIKYFDDLFIFVKVIFFGIIDLLLGVVVVWVFIGIVFV